VGSVTVDQAVITNVALIENTVGAIVGLQVDGALQPTGGVLGTDVVTEDFTTTARVTGSGPGQCDVVTIDLVGSASTRSGSRGWICRRHPWTPRPRARSAACSAVSGVC